MQALDMPFMGNQRSSLFLVDKALPTVMQHTADLERVQTQGMHALILVCWRCDWCYAKGVWWKQRHTPWKHPDDDADPVPAIPCQQLLRLDLRSAAHFGWQP